MNIEKVLDIAVQADPSTVEVLGEVGGRAFIAGNGIRPQFIQKFAELIVKECIDVFSKDLPDPTSPDYQLGSLPEVVNRVANVAEHFGVEE